MNPEINALLDKSERFVISTHTRPDGDAVGSQIALGRLLEQLGKRVTMINSDEPARNLEWLPGANKVELFDGGIRQRELIAGSDVIFIVDTNVEDRLGKVGPAIRNSQAKKVIIDHHPDPENWFDVQLVRETASSTGELIFELVSSRGLELLDLELSTALYVAIMTDTGSFRYSNVSAAVHRAIADLIEHGGIDPEDIHRQLYETGTISGLRLLSAVLNTVTLRLDGRLGFMVVTQRMLNETGADRDDTEGLVNYILAVEGVQVALLFFETDSGTKVSFRSKGHAFVHEWAQSFGGGGHRNASGAFLSGSVDNVIERVLESAETYLGLAGDDDDGEELSPEDRSYLSSLLDAKSRKS